MTGASTFDWIGRRNRAALPQQPVTTAVSPSEHHDTAGDYRAPDDLVEQILVGIYAQVLGVDRVGGR